MYRFFLSLLFIAICVCYRHPLVCNVINNQCWQRLECDATVAVIWFGHCWSIEIFGHAFGRSINIFKATACSRNVRDCPSPDPGEKQGERKERKSFTNAKQRNETETCLRGEQQRDRRGGLQGAAENRKEEGTERDREED